MTEELKTTKELNIKSAHSDGMEEDRLNNLAKIEWITEFFDISDGELE